MENVYMILVVVSLLSNNCNCHKYMDRKRLLDYLFDSSKYENSIRPVKDSATVTKINISHSVHGIYDFDVISGYVCSYSVITLSWTDELLTWNISDYGGITKVNLQPGKCWTPELIHVYSEVCPDKTADGMSVNITLSNDGSVSMHYDMFFEAMCGIDMQIFPFDEHVCVHQFYSKRYNTEELKIQFSEKNIQDSVVFKDNQEWSCHLNGKFVYDSPLHGTSPVSTVSYAMNLMTMKRRPSFIIVNSFAPAWLIAVLILLTPLVPPDSERLSFAITTYLAMVFMNISFVSEIPRNSIEITPLSKGLLAFSTVSTLGIIWSIFIVCLSKKSSKKSKVLDCFRKLMCRRIKDIKSKDGGESINNAECFEKSSKEKIIDFTETDTKDDIGWYEVSRLLDIIYFVMSVITVGVAEFVIFET